MWRILDWLLDLLGLKPKPTALAFVTEYPALFRVELLDAKGDRVKKDGVAITATGTNTRLGGRTTEATIDGMATFATLTYTSVEATMAIRLTFSAPGLASVTSDPITLTPVAVELRILTAPPSTAQDGKLFATPVVVGAFSASGKQVPGVEVTVSADNNGAIVGPTKATTGGTGASFPVGVDDPAI